MAKWVVVAALASLGITGAVRAQETGGDAGVAATLRTITVSGEARVYVKPDEAVMTVGASSESPDLRAAKAAVDVAGKAILSAIRDAGIAEKDIQTDNLRVDLRSPNPFQPQAETGKRVFIVQRHYQVTIRDAARVQGVYDAVVAAGANSINGPAYQTSELRKHRDQARTMALKAAHEKAVAMAAVLGMNVGPVRTIREGSSPEYWPTAMNAQAQAAAFAGGGGGDGGEAPMGQIAVAANVEVVFDLAK